MRLRAGVPAPPGPTSGRGLYPGAGKGPASGCGLGLALEPAPPGVLAHKAGECKHCLGRQLPGGGAAPAQVAGLSQGPAEPCSKTKAKATSLHLGREFASPKTKLLPPRLPLSPPSKAGHGEHGLSGKGKRGGQEKEFGPAEEQAVHGGEEEDGARGGEHQCHRGPRHLEEESVRQDRIQPEITRYWGSLLGTLLRGMLWAGVVPRHPPGCSLEIKKGMSVSVRTHSQLE